MDKKRKVKNSWTRDEVMELKKLADDIILPACDILPDTYDKEIKAYLNWKL